MTPAEAAYHQYREEVSKSRPGVTPREWDYLTPTSKARWERIARATETAINERDHPTPTPTPQPIRHITPHPTPITEPIHRDALRDAKALAANHDA